MWQPNESHPNYVTHFINLLWGHSLHTSKTANNFYSSLSPFCLYLRLPSWSPLMSHYFTLTCHMMRPYKMYYNTWNCMPANYPQILQATTELVYYLKPSWRTTAFYLQIGIFLHLVGKPMGAKATPQHKEWVTAKNSPGQTSVWVILYQKSVVGNETTWGKLEPKTNIQKEQNSKEFRISNFVLLSSFPQAASIFCYSEP